MTNMVAWILAQCDGCQRFLTTIIQPAGPIMSRANLQIFVCLVTSQSDKGLKAPPHIRYTHETLGARPHRCPTDHAAIQLSMKFFTTTIGHGKRTINFGSRRMRFAEKRDSSPSQGGSVELCGTGEQLCAEEFSEYR